MDEQEIQKQLIMAFQDEAQERIEALFSGLSSLEAGEEEDLPEAVIDSVFREAHSLKGAARSVNLPLIESLCQEMESVFAAIKNNSLTFSAELFDTLYAATQLIEKSMAPDADMEEISSQINSMVHYLTDAKTQPGAGKRPSADAGENAEDEKPGSDFTESGSASQASPASDETASNKKKQPEKRNDNQTHPSKQLFSASVRIPTAKLDALLLKAEELIAIKQSIGQQLNRMHELDHAIQEWRQQWEKFQNDFRKIQELNKPGAAVDRTIAFIEDTHEGFQDFDYRVKKTTSLLEHDNRNFRGLIDDLLEAAKKTSLMPFSSLFTVFPRMVRELARDREKSIDFKVSGETVEVDKRILEAIKDPLMHMLRNAIDHGIEPADVRTARGKPALGTIRVAVSQPESSHVCIEIADDGKGIDTGAVKADAVKKGVISGADADAINGDEVFNLIFQSGISSSAVVTQISGRGLGMSIVRDALDHLGGRIRIHSQPEKGTAFYITLPVTLATFRGVLIDVSGHLFVLPNAQVRYSLNIRPENIKTAESRTIISFNARPTSLVHLADVLGLPKLMPEKLQSQKKFIPTVVLENGATQIAFCVNEVITELEVLVKPLGKQLKKVRHFSGATVLGTGQVVPILNVKDLINTAAGQSIPSAQPAVNASEAADKQKMVLIVEDSFTSRTLLKNILEVSGYQVKTAIDGADALSQLKIRQFDAVVSDIEMPQMDGIALTSGIRADKSLADLPVILVTSLDSPKDRERGMEAGADAYIVKSSFDQSDLLDALDRLI